MDTLGGLVLSVSLIGSPAPVPQAPSTIEQVRANIAQINEAGLDCENPNNKFTCGQALMRAVRKEMMNSLRGGIAIDPESGNLLIQSGGKGSKIQIRRNGLVAMHVF